MLRSTNNKPLVIFCLLFTFPFTCFWANNNQPSDAKIYQELLDQAYAATSQDFTEAIALAKKLVRLSESTNAPAVTAEANLLICSMYNSSMNYDSIFTHCEKAIVYFKANNKREKLAWTYNNTGIIYDIMGERALALETFEKGLAIFQQLEHRQGEAYCFNDLGVAYGMAGDYVKAIGYFYRGLKLFESIEDDKLGLARAYTSVGFFYKKIDQQEKAKKYLFDAYEYAKEIDDKYWSAISLSGYVKLLRGEKEYEKALEFNEKILGLASGLNSDYLLLDANKNAAFIYFDIEQYERASTCALKALDLMKEQNRSQSESTMRNLLAEIFLAKEDIEKAWLQLESVLHNPKTSRRGRMNNYKLLGDYHKIKRNYQKALYYQTEYLTQKDSLLKKEKKVAIANIEKGYELGKKQAEIDLLSQQNEIHIAMVENRNRFLGVISILGLILVSVLYRNFYFKKRLNKILEQKIATRTQDLVALNARLEKTNEELKRFAYITSHDLREPLRNISGFLQLIERKKIKLSDEAAKEYITLAKNNAIQMHELIEDVLDFSELDNSMKGDALVNINDIIGKVNVTMKSKNFARPFTIHTKGLPVLQVLTSDMLRLFQNLIENGIKYNQSSIATIEIEGMENDKEYCIFVKDNGIGIEPAYFHKIFEMFSRLHNRNEYQGSGIGLASCKKIVEKYGGEIHVQSKVNNGTTFILTFPKSIH